MSTSETGRSGSRPGPRTLRVLAWSLAGLGVLTSSAAGVAHLEISRRIDVLPIAWPDLVVGAVWPVAGAVLVQRRPRNLCGWVLVSSAAVGVYEAMAHYSLYGTRLADDPLPAQGLTDWVSMWGFTTYFFVVPLVPLLFPDGRALSPPWRRLGIGFVAVAVTATLCRMVVPGPADIDRSIANPGGIDALFGLNWVVLVSAYGLLVVGVPLAVWSLVRRTRRSVGVERAQLQWFMLGGIGLAVGLVGSVVAGSGRLADGLFTAGLLALPVCVVVAAVRHRLLDVDLVLRRSVVLVLVVGAIAAAWFGIVLALRPSAADAPGELVVVALSAVAAVSLREVVQRWVDDRLFPHRRDAGTLSARASRATVDATEPREALQRLVRAVRAELRLPYVAFHGPVGVADGRRPDRVDRIDAVTMGRAVGVLEVGRRRGGEGFGGGERRFLEQVAGQAATLAYAAGLVIDVEQSRGRIVVAREEERRRLRNDLHDGVGPALAGLALQLDALGSRIGRRDGADGAAVHEVRDRVRDVVRDVRAVSHGLRPPILDQVGLGQALRQLVADLGPIRGSASVEGLDGLPAASEVAAYAVAAESVANVVRHSAASRVRLEATRSDDLLVVSVADNGRGMPARPRAGVGLTSMRERAREVGGSLEHRRGDEGGTVVRLELPLAAPTSVLQGLP